MAPQQPHSPGIRKFASSSAALITELILGHNKGQKNGQVKAGAGGSEEWGQRAAKEGALWRSLFCTPLAATLDGALLLSPRGVPHPTRLLFPAHRLLLGSRWKGEGRRCTGGGF